MQNAVKNICAVAPFIVLHHVNIVGFTVAYVLSGISLQPKITEWQIYVSWR